MQDSANSRIEKNSNFVSRNRPVALVLNACTFIGSHVIDFLLEKDIQVIAIDDLTISDKKILDSSSKNKDFHLLNEAIDQDSVVEKISKLDLPRLDYSFFITDQSVPDVVIGKGIVNFINIAAEFKKASAHADRPRLVMSSSISLYGRNLEGKERILKEAEVKFAKGIKHFKLNGRIVRLAEVFGPRMDLENQNPLTRLIVASLLDKLEEEKISLVFTERSLYIDDAVKLLTKSAFSGATSNKIYDGALLHPIKLSEIKQVLMSPVWSEENPPEFEKLPAWPTPNLVKTMKELSWSSKASIMKALRETTAYFKERPELVPQEKEPVKFNKSVNWSFAGTGFLGDEEKEAIAREMRSEKSKNKKSEENNFDTSLEAEKKKSFSSKAKRIIAIAAIGGIIAYGLIWPIVFLAYQGYSIKSHLLASRDHLEKGEFGAAEEEIYKAKSSINEFQSVLDNTGILKKIPGVSTIIQKSDRIIDLAEEGTDGILYATIGSESLFETTKIISGESREDPAKYYEDAQRDLQFASTKLSKVYAGLSDEELSKDLPGLITGRIEDLRVRLAFYQVLVDQAKTASLLMPDITALGNKKSYLVLLQNNLELRPGGGFIGSYGKLDFEDGRLKEIKVDDIYNLDGALQEVIEPPAELKNDLGVERLFLRDSNYEPDFPTSARLASLFYRKEAGETVQGVIALDLKASGYLLDAVGGLDLPEYGEAVGGSNLFERAITHAETNFFPGSQAKKNYLTSLQNQLFNKMFYLSKQNWPAIIQAIGKSLKEKHMIVYLEDPKLFSYLASSNWSGVFPRGSEKREGETRDFLAVIESNMGANKSNYYLQRKVSLDTSFTKEGKVMHVLKINYKNTSPTNVFPAGKYKNRIKIYTPLGSKLNKALFGEADITNLFTPFSDYERSAFSALIEVEPKEQKTLIFEYELTDPLMFVENETTYRMEIFKQPGTMADPLDFVLTYPINFKLAKKPDQGSAGVQEVKIATDLQTDRVFEFKLTN